MSRKASSDRCRRRSRSSSQSLAFHFAGWRLARSQDFGKAAWEGRPTFDWVGGLGRPPYAKLSFGVARDDEILEGRSWGWGFWSVSPDCH